MTRKTEKERKAEVLDEMARWHESCADIFRSNMSTHPLEGMLQFHEREAAAFRSQASVLRNG